MELHVIEDTGGNIVVLLNDEMKIVKPVYDYIKFMGLKGRALNSMKAAGSDLRTYWRFLQKYHYRYDQVTPNAIADFIDYLRRGDMSPDVIGVYVESVRTGRTINRILSTVHQFYKYCGMVQEIDNPIIMENINRPFNMFKSILHHTRTDNQTKQSIFKVKKESRPIHLVSKKEAEIFLTALPRWRDRLIFKIMYLTGTRIQETLDLLIENVPMPDSSQPVGVFQQIKSKGKYRDLYLPMELVEEIDRFILEERSRIETEHSYIFVSEQPQNLGNHLTYRAEWEVFQRVQEKTDITFHFHDLRHTFVSRCVESGMDVSIVKILAGHEHLSTTQMYTHLSDPYIDQSLTEYWAKAPLLGGVIDDRSAQR